MAKKIDPVAAKAAKQKKIAIAGGVLLLGLLAFQVPRTMKMLNSGGNVTTSASTAPASTDATGSTPLAPPSLDGGATGSTGASAPSGPSAATSDDGVIDPATPLPPSSGQLVSFNRFKSKDPFRQQISDCSANNPCANAAAPSTAGAGSGTSGGSTDTSGGGNGTSAGSGAQPAKTAPVSSAPAKTAVKLTTATISVNGAIEKVSVGGSFPAADPVFTLVAVTAKEAMIGIAGGSLQSGADAVGLKVGKALKLQNTADQTLYALKLISVS